MSDRTIPDDRPLTPDEEVDNAIDESFPASDPPSYSTGKRHRGPDESSDDPTVESKRETQTEFGEHPGP